MHTLVWVSTEADSIEEAESKVTGYLLSVSGEGQWWDWFDEEIGGRWKDNAQTTCASNSDEYEAVIERVKNARVEEFNRLKEKVHIEDIELAIMKYDGDSLSSMDIWRVNSMLEMMSGTWNSNAYYYDMEEWTTELRYVKARVASNPSQQYLVPIDFHF